MMFDCCSCSKLLPRTLLPEGSRIYLLQHHDGHEEETKCLIVVLVEKYQEGRYSNKEFVAASGGRKEETKCLIVVSPVNSMGKEFTTGRVKEAGIPRRVKREEKRDFGGGFGEKKPSHH
jgi:hypothetical protein